MRMFLAGLVIFACLIGDAHADLVTIPLPDGTPLQAELFRPAKPSNLPAVILLHGCGGPFPARDDQWRDLFLLQGRIVLKPLSFLSRGLGSQCDAPDAHAPSGTVRRDDTIAAARWLTAQPGTPPGGLVVMGWSHGGSTVLAAANAMPPGLVRGYVAMYPGCGVVRGIPDWHTKVPLLVLMGEDDDWTPLAPCRARIGRAANVQIPAYPDTYHDFDSPLPVKMRPGSGGKMVHAGNNETSRRDALKRVPEFVAGLAAVAP